MQPEAIKLIKNLPKRCQKLSRVATKIFKSRSSKQTNKKVRVPKGYIHVCDTMSQLIYLHNSFALTGLRPDRISVRYHRYPTQQKRFTSMTVSYKKRRVIRRAFKKKKFGPANDCLLGVIEVQLYIEGNCYSSILKYQNPNDSRIASHPSPSPLKKTLTSTPSLDLYEIKILCKGKYMHAFCSE